jgi:hypothetical protein
MLMRRLEEYADICLEKGACASATILPLDPVSLSNIRFVLADTLAACFLCFDGN